jgi:TolB protein
MSGTVGAVKRLALLLLFASACIPEPPAGDGGAGGGGAQLNTFSSGFVFVRNADREVYVSDASDFTTAYRLTTGANARTPSLSRDGKTVVFVKVLVGDTELDTVPSRGGDTHAVLKASTLPSARNLRTPVFTTDGTHVVFSYDDGATGSIGIVALDGSGFVKVSPLSGFAYSGASVFPNGNAVLAAAGAGLDMLSELHRIDLTTGAETVVTQTLGLDAVNLASRVVVSPDGTLATFDARVSSSSVRVFAIDLGTKAVGQLTDYPGEPNVNDAAPCWRGSDVAYASTLGGADEVYTLPPSSLRTQGTLELHDAADPWFGPN